MCKHTSLVSNTSHQLSEQSQVEDEGRGQKRVLASVVHDDGVLAAQEDLANVFVHSSLAVTDVRNVLDDDAVVGVVTRLVQDLVRGNHIVDNVGFADLLRSELFFGGQVLAVIVTQMVVANNGDGLQTSRDQKVDHDGLDLGLSGFEVITTNHNVVALSQFDGSGNKGVLRRTVDIRNAFQDTGNGEQSRRANFALVTFNGGEQIVGGVVQTSTNISKALSVGRPDNNNLVDVVLSFEFLNSDCRLVKNRIFW